MNNYKEISLLEIENSITDFFNSKIEDSNYPPDLVILEEGNYFHAKIKGDKVKVTTGKGGLKMFFEQGIPFIKTQYNGKILNQEEYEQLKTRICS